MMTVTAIIWNWKKKKRIARMLLGGTFPIIGIKFDVIIGEYKKKKKKRSSFHLLQETKYNRTVHDYAG